MKAWFYTNSNAVIPAAKTIIVALIGAVSTIIVAAINKHKPSKKALQEEKFQNFQKRRPQPKISSFQYRLGEVYSEQNNFQRASECYKQAADEYEHDSLSCAAALYKAGLMHRELVQYDEAIEYFLEAKAIYKSAAKACKKELSWINSNLVVVHELKNRNEKALRVGQIP